MDFSVGLVWLLPFGVGHPILGRCFLIPPCSGSSLPHPDHWLENLPLPGRVSSQVLPGFPFSSFNSFQVPQTLL